jgi:D-alanyl-D-alanine carboxypeptidase
MFRKTSRNEIVFIVLFVASVVLVSILFFSFLVKPTVVLIEAPELLQKFEVPQIEARAAYVYDVTADKVLFQKNALTPMPLASLTKIMTAVVAHEELPSDASISITENTSRQPDYLASSTGEFWQRDELTRFMLFVSSNMAAETLNEALKNENKGLVFLMNKKAEDLHLKTLSFANPSGLDSLSGEGSSYGGAKDIASLFIYATSFYPYLFEPTEFKEYNFISGNGTNHPGTNTNDLAGKIPGLYASKTGFTVLAGGNLLVGFENKGHKIVVVVLGSEKESRFSDVEALVTEAIKVIK